MNLAPEEQKLILRIAENISGIHRTETFNASILFSNIARRISATGSKNLDTYLRIVESDKIEAQNFISALTIHTTEWFRERPHFNILERKVEDWIIKDNVERIKILSAGCSTGEEVYSFAAMFQSIKMRHPSFSYTIEGIDIDPKSIEKANRGIYSADSLNSIPVNFRHFFSTSRSKDGTFSPIADLKQNCQFSVSSLADATNRRKRYYDIIICRHVLI